MPQTSAIPAPHASANLLQGLQTYAGLGSQAGVATAAGAQAAAGAPSMAVPVAQVPVEITRQIQGGSTSFDIRLQPAELGSIEVRLEPRRGGAAARRSRM